MSTVKALLSVLAAACLLTVITCTKNPAGPGSGPDPVINYGTMTDQDGNVYKTVKIGNQEWMAENLRVTKYNDGTAITLETSLIDWNNSTSPKYCFNLYTATADIIKKYGAYYNWYVINTGKLAPAGWHVPTDAEWTTLEKYLVLNGYNWDRTRDTAQDNKIAKSLAAETDWHTYTTKGTIGCDLTKNNRTGFSALPGGFCDYDGSFSSAQDGYCGSWWSATEADASSARRRGLGAELDYLISDNRNKRCGLSVRLVRD